uniref:Uncharacterized protein n=1 Tax=Oryza rufipogon TaxID=4529 RepID=A0A0E0RIE8_ORYRU
MDLPRPAPSSSNPTEIRHGRLLAMQGKTFSSPAICIIAAASLATSSSKTCLANRWIHGSSRAFLAVQQRVVPKPELWDDAVIWEKQGEYIISDSASCDYHVLAVDMTDA